MKPRSGAIQALSIYIAGLYRALGFRESSKGMLYQSYQSGARSTSTVDDINPALP